MRPEKVLIDTFSPRTRRQPQRPAVPSEEDIREAQRSRQSRREAAKRRIAAARLAEQRMNETAEAIAALEIKKEMAADEHIRKCEPLQSELKEIEEQQIAHLKAREELDPDMEMRRRELLCHLQAANEDLESYIESQDRLIGNLHGERVSFAKQATASILEQDLIGLGRRDLVLAMKVCQRSVEWCERRVRAVADDRRSPRGLHAVELAAAQAALAAAKRELAEATEAVMSE